MQELGITDIFTGDSHFLHVGFGFTPWPSVGMIATEAKHRQSRAFGFSTNS